MTREEVGLKEEQVQCHEAHEALEKLAEQRAELKIQIESIQQRRKEERQLVSLSYNILMKPAIS